VVLLRGLLVLALGGLLLDARVTGPAAWTGLALLGGMSLSVVALLFVPRRLFGRSSFDLAVGGADLVLIGVGLMIAGATGGALPVSCLLMTLIVALSGQRSHLACGALAVGALHAWLTLGASMQPQPIHGIALQIFFLCSVSMYYGRMVEAIHRRRRREQAEALGYQDLSALLDITRTLTASLDEQEVSLTAVRRLNDVVPSQRCSLLRLDASGRCFVLASHDAPRLDRLEIDLRKYPEVRQAITTREPVVIADTLEHPLTAPVRDQLANLSFRSILVVPLAVDDAVFGALCLRAEREPPEFSPREVHFCSAVAQAWANAMKNALLHRQVIEESDRRRSAGESLQRILDHSPDVIMTTDGLGRITEFNRGAQKLLGWRKDEVLGWPSSVLLADPRDLSLLERLRATGVLSSVTCRLAKKQGGQVDVELHMSLLEESGAEPGAVWIGRDLTELNATQLQLIQAGKLSAIGEVISGVAHELNNPLSAVLGFSQLVLARQGDGPAARELEQIHEAALRCQKIVKNLLSFSRVHKPERRHLGVNGILEKTLDLKQYQLQVADIDVVKDLDPQLPCTMVDFHQMQQVFLNLLQNAEHAIASAKRPGRIAVRTSLAASYIRIEISDDGVGMDATTRERIFDPFFTTKEPGHGTGLGLSVSYGIIKQHGGRIGVRSTPGEGTTFVIELPVLDATGAADVLRPSRKATQPARTGSRILIVDDEAMILDLVLAVLTDLGHRVDTAANGREACRKVGAGSYDLVITDVRMPQMNGIELYDNLVAIRPGLEGRVVFMTGAMPDGDTTAFFNRVRAHCLPKPIDIPALTEVVRQTLQQPPDA